MCLEQNTVGCLDTPASFAARLAALGKTGSLRSHPLADD
jgi:hypothetical protein